MGKVAVLFVMSLSALANAQGLAEILEERASNTIGNAATDLDDATLMKASKGGGAPKSAPVAQRSVQGGRNVFGGTNKLLAGKGMPVQEKTPQTPGYWGGKKDPRTIQIYKIGGQKAKAIAERPVEGAFPVPQSMEKSSFIRGRPFELADLSTGTALSCIAFFVVAMTMMSFGVFFSRRRCSASEQEPYVSAP